MKKTAHTFYIVAKWVQLALVILCALAVVGCTIAVIVSAITDNGWVAYWVARLIVSFIYLGIEIAAWIVVLHAIKKQNEDSKSKAPHIMCIVAGAFANPCYFVGGILSLILVCRGQEVEPIQAISKEQVKDAVSREKPAKEEKEESK